jgi:hypothetical protein
MTDNDHQNTPKAGLMQDAPGPLGVPFDDEDFKTILNNYYATTSEMQATAKMIAGSSLQEMAESLFSLDNETPTRLLPGTRDILQWGNYQIIILQDYLKKYPSANPKIKSLINKWSIDSDIARKNLAKLENFIPTFPGSSEIPRYKLGVLDAIVRRCFTKCACDQLVPGIPIEIDIAMKSPEDPNPSQHDIEFYWVIRRDKTTHKKEPVKLYLRMICPYTPPCK